MPRGLGQVQTKGNYMMDYYFAYHATSNTENFNFKGGYGFSKPVKHKWDNVSVGDIVYVIQKLKKSKVFELCGKYKIIDKHHSPEENPTKEYRLAFSDLTMLEKPLEIDEEFWGKMIPEVKAVHGWNNFKETFCPQKANVAQKLSQDIILVFENFLNIEPDTDDSEAEIDKINSSTTISKTEKEQLIKSRRGQGIFKARLKLIEKCCRILGTHHQNHLIASHIKPWINSSDEERLDGNNGLLLTPNVDHLFDKGYISFEDNGDLIISDHVPLDLLSQWAIKKENYRKFNIKQKEYMQYHRGKVFEKFIKK